jgi:4-amino-4-deoxy-L-arabinose transferase-like glycosyltransferase
LIPPWQGPDETRNFMAVLAGSSGIPIQAAVPLDGSIGEPVLDSLDTYDFWRLSEHTIPKSIVTIPTPSPFLSWFLTLPSWIFSFSDIVSHLIFLRFFSFLLHIGVVWITFQLAMQLEPDAPWMAFSAVAFVAFHPQYSFQSGIFSLDCYLIFFFSLIVYVLSRLPFARRPGLGLGALVVLSGLAVVTKRIGLVALPLCLAGLFLVALRRSASTRRFRQLIYGALLIVIGGGLGTVLFRGAIWEVSHLVFEEWYLLGDWGEFLSYSFRSIYMSISGAFGAPPGMARIVRSLGILYVSFWFSYGWMIYKLSYGWYVILLGVAGWGIVGLSIAMLRRSVRARLNTHVLSILFVALLTVVASVVTAVLFHPLWNPNDAHGRYLFPALVPMAILMAIGIRGSVPEVYKDTASQAFTLFFIMLNLVCVVKYLIPLFYL